MTDRPILFSADMIRALLDGRKTMTRRLALGKPRPMPKIKRPHRVVSCRIVSEGVVRVATVWTHVRPGDRLWVKETFSMATGIMSLVERPIYRADEGTDRCEGMMWSAGKWTPSIFMPRRASRLTLAVTAVKMERLQDISEDDAIAEGAAKYLPETGLWDADLPPEHDGSPYHSPRIAFADLWDSLHGELAWFNNPEVVAISFRVLKTNIDNAVGP